MTLYNNPVPVAVAVIRVIGEDGKMGLLAIRRPDNGGLALPGGYVDELESAENAAARELNEEVGIHISPSHFRPIRTMTSGNNRLLVFCLAKQVMSLSDFKNFVPNDEASEVRVVYRSDVLVFPLHQSILDDIYLW
jgi:8-oxo-dGTP pyrophosphatase MutT (NUDIX family)